jgi:DNA-binding transcriptional LysR family regulator
MVLNFNQINVFLTVAQKKSFSETAKILHMSQPSVTSQVKALEGQLGTKLLDRDTKHVALTEAGKIFLRYAKKVQSLTDHMQKEISSLSDFPTGKLVTAASLTTGEVIVPLILNTFKELYPKIRINIKIINTEQIIQNILDGILDIGLIEAPYVHPNLEVVPFAIDELVLITSKIFQHPGLNEIRGTATPSLLQETPLILREKGSGTRKVLEDCYKKLGLDKDRMQPYCELGSTEAIKSVVSNNLGVSVISRSAIDRELKLQTLKMYRFEQLDLFRQFYYVHKKVSILPFEVELLIKELSTTKNVNKENIGLFDWEI